MPDDRRPEDMGYVSEEERAADTHYAQRYARRFELNLRLFHALDALDNALGLDSETLVTLYSRLARVNITMTDEVVERLLKDQGLDEKEREEMPQFKRIIGSREDNEPHEFAAELVRQTDGAFLLDFGGNKPEWFPKSKTEEVSKGRWECPVWLATKKGVV